MEHNDQVCRAATKCVCEVPASNLDLGVCLTTGHDFPLVSPFQLTADDISDYT